MSLACGCSSSRAVASISSVVVSPLPHSFTMSRNGALVMPAMGAMRAREGISTGPIFIRPPVYRGRGRRELSPSPALDSLDEGPDLAIEHVDVGGKESRGR